MSTADVAAFHQAHLAGLSSIRQHGYALLTPVQLEQVCAVRGAELDALRDSWRTLPRDIYLRDGGNYRHRRHSCYIYRTDDATLTAAPPRAHWQPTSYNALHGGMERWFEPVAPAIATSNAWQRLLTGLGAAFAALRSEPLWYVEAHQFRIDTEEGIGRPTPEGAHRDGVDFVAVILVNRHHVRGGETRVFQAHGNAGIRFTMSEPWTALLLDDAQVIHETTPIQSDGGGGVRDTLVLTYRAGAFQAPGPKNN